MAGLFEGKQGLITGVFNKQSIAWAISDQIMAQGGDCGFTYMPDRPDDARQKNLKRIKKLTDGNPRCKFVLPMDATNDDHIAEMVKKCDSEFGKIDFLLHSIAYCPPDDLKGDTVDASREGFKMAMAISVHSLMALSSALKDHMAPDASILTLTYYGGEKAVPGYNVMGVCKAALDATVRYLAFDLGPRSIRVNALSAGPLQTISGRGAGVDAMLDMYKEVAPLGRNITHEEVGKSGTFLLSDMSSGISGEILHIDGGYHAMGTAGRLLHRLKELG